MNLALQLIRFASWAVPAGYRLEWRREWEAEIQNVLRVLRERGEPDRIIRARLLEFARGSFRDAAWCGRDLWNRERLTASFSYQAHSPAFCLAALAVLIPLIGLLSGFFPNTRRAILPLPYRDPGRVATIAESGTLAMRYGIPEGSVRLWKEHSRTVEDFATYSWGPFEGGLLAARVSSNFFSLLGAPAGTSDLSSCFNCAVVSRAYWQEHGGETISLGGRNYLVAGILDQDFWFLSPRIAAFVIVPPGKPETRTGVVLRLARDASASDAEHELGAILRQSGRNEWESVVEISPLSKRVHSVFGSFGLAVAMAIITTIVALQIRPARPVNGALLRSAFFLMKTALGLTAVLLAGMEFTRASSINMLGGTDALTEPLSSWLFLMGSMGVLFWSMHDQRHRCRICLRRLGLAAHVGCTGCMLLDWAGTELVCMEGHGMLHVPEMVACWQDPRKWSSLDDSWQSLFERSAQ